MTIKQLLEDIMQERVGSDVVEFDYDQTDVLSEERERTSSFVYTHKPGNASHEKKLEDLKTYARVHNQLHPESKKRITMKGRLGENNPHAHLYRVGGPEHRSIAQNIKPQHAKHFDVYVHDKN